MENDLPTKSVLFVHKLGSVKDTSGTAHDAEAMRAYDASCAADLFAAVERERERVGCAELSEFEVAARSPASLHQWLCQPFLRAFVLRVDGSVVGAVYFIRDNAWDDGYRCSCLFWISGLWEGRGLVSSAVRVLCQDLLQNTKIFRVELACSVSNTRAEKLARRAGFVLEGTRRHGIPAANGTECWLDVHVWSFLKSDAKEFPLEDDA